MKKHAGRNVSESVGYHGAESIDQTAWKYSPHAERWPLFPIMVEETVRHNLFRFKESYCRFFYLTLLMHGKIRYHHSGRTFILDTNSILLIPPGCDYGFDSVETGGYRKIVLELSGTHLSSICTSLGLDEFQIFPLKEPDAVVNYFFHVRDILSRNKPEDIPDLLGGVYAFLAGLVLLRKELKGKSDFVAQAQTLLESRTEPGIEISEIAERLGIPVSSLNRMFQARLNLSPVQYRNAWRIEQARTLLERSSLSVKEISAELGFCNQFYFCQLFRKLNGCSPSGFRKTIRKPEKFNFSSCESGRESVRRDR